MPPLLYWALEAIEQTTIADGFTIITQTDVACHQWLRHTLIPPQKHAKPVFTRGLLMKWDARFCFVAFEDLEQDEPGDTYTHTFTWTGWTECQTRWFYFWATSVGEKMKSTSPIFSKHFVPPLGPTLQEHHFYPCADDSFVNSPAQQAQTFTPVVDFICTRIDTPWWRSWELATGTLHIELQECTGFYPNGTVLASATFDIDSWDVGVIYWLEASIPSVPLTKDVLYAIVSYVTDYRFGWAPPMSKSDHDDPYQVGERVIRDSPTLAWYGSPSYHDMCFKTWG